MDNVTYKWERLNEAFESIGLITQVQIGEAFGVRQTCVSKWKLGQTSPTLKHIFDISDATGYCIEWLIRGTGPKRYDDPVVHRFQDPPYKVNQSVWPNDWE